MRIPSRPHSSAATREHLLGLARSLGVALEVLGVVARVGGRVASECVWSTYLNGRIAWRIASTDGVGASARSMCVRISFTICGSDSRSSFDSATRWSSRTGEKPAGSMCSRS